MGIGEGSQGDALEPSELAEEAALEAAAESAGLHRGGVAKRAIGASFGTSAAIQLLNTASGILLARTLGPSDRGALAAALLWPTIAAAVGTIGVMEAATYYAAKREMPAGTIVGSGLVLVLVQSLLFTAIAAAILPLVLSSKGHEVLLASYAYLVYIPLNIGAQFLSGVLNGLERYARFQMMRLMVIVVTLAILAGLAIGGELTVTTAVLAYAGATALTVAIIVLWVRREVHRLAVSRRVMRLLFGYGLRSHSSTVSSQFNERSDQLVISIFLSAHALGIYVIAVTLTSATYLLGGSVVFVALPQVAAATAGPQRVMLAKRFVHLTFYGSLLLSVPIVILAEPLVTLFFGDAYAQAIGLTRILVLAVVLLSTNRVLEAVLRGLGRPLDAGVAELIALGATFASLATLLPLLGLTGAAVASFVAYGVSSVWMTRRVARALEIPVRAVVVPTREDYRWTRAAVGRLLRSLAPWRAARAR